MAENVWWQGLYEDQNEKPDNPTWGDYGRALGAGAADVAAGQAANVRAATDEAPTAIGRFSNEMSKVLQKSLNETATETRGNMSDVAQQRLGAAVTSRDFWEHPISASALKTTGMAPAMAAMVFSGGPVGAAISGGALSAGEFNNTVDQLLDTKTDEELRQNEWYASLRSAGMGEDDARRDLKDKISGNKALVNFLTGTIAGALGPAAKVAGAVSGKAAAGLAGEGASVLRRAGSGALEGGVSELGEEATQNATGQLAEMDFDPKKKFDTRKIVDAAAEGLLFGGVLGGAAGAATGGHAKSKRADAHAEVVTVDVGAPAPDQAIALALEQNIAQPATVGEVAPEIEAPPITPPSAPMPAPVAAQPAPAPVSPIAEATPAPVADPQLAAQPAPQVAPEPVSAPAPEVGVAAAPPVESRVPATSAPVELAPAPAGPVQTETAPAAVPAPGRILKAITPEAKAKEAEIEGQVKAEAKKIRENIKAIEQPKLSTGKHFTIKEREERAASAANAKVVFDKHVPEQAVFPTTPEQREGLRTRLGAMVAEADQLGIKVPTKVGYEGTAAHVIYLRAAKDLHRKLAQKSFTGARAREQIEGFLIAERSAKSGDFATLRDMRKVEGDIAKRREQGDVDQQAAVTTADIEGTDDYAGDGADHAPVAVAKSARGMRDNAAEERPAAQVRKVELTEDVKAKALAALEVAKRRAVERNDAIDAVAPAPAEAAVTPKVTPRVAEAIAKVKIKSEIKSASPEILKAPSAVVERAKTKAAADKVVAETVNTKPTEAQKEAGNYAKAHLKIGSYDITVENPRGTKREGVSASGKKWSVTMPDHYGYIKRTEGADGDHVDVYLGPKAYPGSQVLDEVNVYVVHQKDLKTGEFDEHKVMLGYDTQDKAELAYDNGFSDGRGRQRIQKVDVMTPAEFKTWVKSSAPKENAPVAPDPGVELARVAREYVAAKIDEPTAKGQLKDVSDADWQSAIQKAMAEEYGAGLDKKGKSLTTNDGEVVPHMYAMSARDLLEKLPRDHLAGVPKAMANFMHARLRMLAGDTPVMIYSRDQFARLVGDDSVLLEPDADGFVGLHKLHQDGSQSVALRYDVLSDKQKGVRAALHEIVHAATHRAVLENKTHHQDISRLMREVSSWLNQSDASAKAIAEYGMSNPVEFIAEAFSNPAFQEMLTGIKVSEDLAAHLGLSNRRLANAWDALVGFVRRVLVNILGGVPNAHTALDAIIRIGSNVERTRLRELTEAELSGTRRPIDISKLHTAALNTQDVDAAKTNVVGRIRRAKDKLSSFKQLAERSGAIFGEDKPIEKMFAARARMEHDKDQILEQGGGAQFVRDVAAYERTHGSEAARTLAEVAFDASNHNVVLGANADNNHLGVDATRGWQAKVRLPQLQARFNELPEDGQALLTRGADFFRRMHNEVSLQNIKNVLDVADIHVTGLAERIHQDGLTQSDRDQYLGDKPNTIIKALNEAHEVKEIKGWYFPFRRYGEFTSTGYQQFATPNGATRIDDSTVQFHAKGDTAARRAAKAFVESSDLRHVETKHVWVDVNDPTKILEKEDVDAVPAYRVTLQNKQVEFHDTEAEAETAAEDYRAQGLQNVNTGRLDENMQRQSVDVSNRVGQLLDAMEKQTRFKAMDAPAQAALRQALRETLISAMGSTHLKSVMHQRRNVAGMSQDLARVAADYGRMAANYIAKLRHQPAIDKLFAQIGAYAKAHKYDGNSLRRDELIKTLKERVYNSNADQAQDPGFVNDATRRLLQVTRLARLAGVSFHVINSQEPWTTSLPVIGGRHGFAQTSKAIVEAYNTIGARGGVIAGFRDTAKAFNADTGFTDYVSLFKRNIEQSPMLGGSRATRLKEALEYGERLNLYGNDTKFEVGKYADPTGNVVGRAFDRADLMANQVGSAIEGINRAVTSLAAYELEYRKNGGNHEAAMAYAYEVAHVTMGDYSAWNAAPVFNTKFGRLALQFKKFGHKMYYLLGKTVQGTLAGDPEAAKQFVGLMVTHAMVAGALGLPIEPFKVALLGANAFGITGYSPDDFEDTVRRLAAEVLGNKGGEVFAHGLPRALGIDTSSRQGLDSLMTFGAPKSAKANDIKSWLFDTMAGAPSGYLLDQVAAAQALMKGDVVTALEKSVPIRAVTDVVKAVDGISGPKLNDDGRERRPAMTGYQAGVRALGFTPSAVTENYKKNVTFAKATREQSDQRNKILAEWATARPADRQKLWGKIERANMELPREAKITRAQLDNYAKRRDGEKAKAVNGLRAGKANRAIAEKLDYYNTN